MENKSHLSFNTPEVKVKISTKLDEYQKRFGIPDRDMVYILMQELSHYYVKSLIRQSQLEEG